VIDDGLTDRLLTDEGPATPLTLMGRNDLTAWLADQPVAVRAWVEAAGFDAAPASVCRLPGADGDVARALVGTGDGPPDTWTLGDAARHLKHGIWRLDPEPDPEAADVLALGWVLGGYAYNRFKSETDDATAALVWPAAADRTAVTRAARGTVLVRDLINTPASHLGPAGLAEAAGSLAQRHGAELTTIVGDDLPAAGWPAVHAVGRGAGRAPRLIDLRWGDPEHPRVVLAGKGVVFDTGGLDIKPAEGMKLMKKDMGGAAHTLALAEMVMDARLPVRLRLLVPAVENAVGADAMRPGDVVATRAGTTVEIGHTDAEGRVVLADALAAAAEEDPALVVDCATLTGAARVALGPEVPAFFTPDDGLARALGAASEAVGDPVWRLPLWRAYGDAVTGRVADVTNAPEMPQGHGGAITAALFLERFAGRDRPWIHLDQMAWMPRARPGRPEGGEAQGLRALFRFLRDRFGGEAT